MKKQKEKTPKTKKQKAEEAPVQLVQPVEKPVETPVEKLETVEKVEEVKTLTIPVDLIAKVALMGVELLLIFLKKKMENGVVQDKIKEDAELYKAIKEGDGETIARIIKYRKEYKQ